MDFTFVPVSAFVQADSQQPNPNANGIFVANAGAGLLAWGAPIGPIQSGAITGNINTSQAITLAAVTGVSFGVNWRLGVGQTIVLDPNTPTQEAFVIQSVLPATNQVTGVIRNNHSAPAGGLGVTATAFFLDQARSAMDPDGGSPQGSAQVQLTAIDARTGLLYGARAATTNGLPATNATVVSQGLVNLIGTVDPQRTDGAGRLSTSDQDLLAQILIELRTMNLVLQEGLNTQTDADDYRTSVSVDFPLN